MRRRVFALLLLAPALFGQISTSSSSVTVTATLGQNVQPDQAIFTVTIESGATTTLGDVMNALQGTNLSLQSFSSVYSSQVYSANVSQTSMVLEWTFQFPAPFSGMKSQIAALKALAASLPKDKCRSS